MVRCREACQLVRVGDVGRYALEFLTSLFAEVPNLFAEVPDLLVPDFLICYLLDVLC
jgi:hypothetical protein